MRTQKILLGLVLAVSGWNAFAEEETPATPNRQASVRISIERQTYRRKTDKGEIGYESSHTKICEGTAKIPVYDIRLPQDGNRVPPLQPAFTCEVDLEGIGRAHANFFGIVFVMPWDAFTGESTPEHFSKKFNSAFYLEKADKTPIGKFNMLKDGATVILPDPDHKQVILPMTSQSVGEWGEESIDSFTATVEITDTPQS